MISEKAIGTLRQQAEITKAGRKPALRMMVRMAFQCVLGVALLGALLVTAAHTAQAQTLTTIYSFTYGSRPEAGLVLDANGNLFGTTSGPDGGGTVFELTPDGVEEVLYSFSSKNKGGYGPYAGLVRDANGNLFGTTEFGGVHNHGTVFQVTPTATETVLHAFSGYPYDGGRPAAGLVQDGQGNLYGTTFQGGAARKGTVFKVTPAGAETAIYSFGPKSSGDGENPFGGLILDAEGNLYGSTFEGGRFHGCHYPGVAGCGIVFEVSPTGQETRLYAFAGEKNNDGAEPVGGLLRDAQGNLYGTTLEGGTVDLGTVFKLALGGTETVLYSFMGGADGALPEAGLVSDAQGNLYGTTSMGGGSGCQGYGCGTVFKMTPDGTETVLYRFTGGVDGGYPLAPLVFDGQGNLYGTTMSGGVYDGGTVFELTP